MLTKSFGIEIEFTGITRANASKIAAKYLNARVEHTGGYYDTYTVYAPDCRRWRFMSDASINCQKKEKGYKAGTSNNYSVELVSPILNYRQDIETVQELVRLLRQAGAFTNDSCGIHIHLNGSDHTVKSIKNFINIIASKNDLFYTALGIKPERIRYCKSIDTRLVNSINSKNSKSMSALENIWYDGYYGSKHTHYHDSRYHFLNLHSFFTENHTVELRGFNSELHAGKIRSYIVLALALNHQALTQRFASSKKPQIENQKFAMRTYLNRIGFIGEEFKNCRDHLTAKLRGSSAWRFSKIA